MSTNHGKCALIFPEPYRGTVRDPRNPEKEVTVIEAATYYDLPPLLVRIGDWVVTSKGLDCLYPTPYYIAKERLQEMDWNRQLGEKTWVNMGAFTAALGVARSMVELGYI